MKITAEKFKEALIDTAGVYSNIAKKLGVHRSTITKFLKRHKRLMPLIKEETEKMIDLAENKMFNKINNGEWPATQFYLKTKGKERGYVEKYEQEHSGEIDNKLEVEVIIVNKNEDEIENDDSLRKD